MYDGYEANDVMNSQEHTTDMQFPCWFSPLPEVKTHEERDFDVLSNESSVTRSTKCLIILSVDPEVMFEQIYVCICFFIY